ncbi:hypothetical protein JW710_03590 [Candidatus Dojkabacteria bacterium]|nr:hypothetical protein [Candidatus Dojkabacteria bacterium]
MQGNETTGYSLGPQWFHSSDIIGSGETTQQKWLKEADASTIYNEDGLYSIYPSGTVDGIEGLADVSHISPAESSSRMGTYLYGLWCYNQEDPEDRRFHQLLYLICLHEDDGVGHALEAVTGIAAELDQMNNRGREYALRFVDDVCCSLLGLVADPEVFDHLANSDGIAALREWGYLLFYSRVGADVAESDARIHPVTDKLEPLKEVLDIVAQKYVMSEPDYERLVETFPGLKGSGRYKSITHMAVLCSRMALPSEDLAVLLLSEVSRHCAMNIFGVGVPPDQLLSMFSTELGYQCVVGLYLGIDLRRRVYR